MKKSETISVTEPRKKTNEAKKLSEFYHPIAKITNCDFSVNIRSEPRRDSKSVKVLREGELVRILDEDIEKLYYRICMETDKSVVGYVPFEYCTKLEDIKEEQING